MRGNITKRGKNSWRLKFDAGRDSNGKRKIQWHTFRGSKRQAQVRLAELIASVGAGNYVEPNRVTVADHVRGRIDQWESAGDISARTAQRYRELTNNQIAPHIGTVTLQKLRVADIENWHATLRTTGRARGKGGVAPRTIGHAHRVLSKALNDAVRHGLVPANVARIEAAPKVPSEEMVIVHDVPGMVEKLQGSRLRLPAMVALFTGMRLGEVLALRWGRVDLDGKSVRETLENTNAHGLRFKPPKSKAGRRGYHPAR